MSADPAAKKLIFTSAEDHWRSAVADELHVLAEEIKMAIERAQVPASEPGALTLLAVSGGLIKVHADQLMSNLGKLEALERIRGAVAE
jgi:hypothetical protein